jgi:hypothetical protein
MGAQSSALSDSLVRLAAAEEGKSIQDVEFWDGLIPRVYLPEKSVAAEVLAFAKGDSTTPPGVENPPLMEKLQKERPKNLATFIRRTVLRIEVATRIPMFNKFDQLQTINAMYVTTSVLSRGSQHRQLRCITWCRRVDKY